MFAEIISQTTDASRHESRRSWNIFSSFFHQFCHSFWLAPNCRLPCTKGMRLESPDTRAEMQSFPCSPQWCSLLFTKRVSRLIKRFRAFTASRVFAAAGPRRGNSTDLFPPKGGFTPSHPLPKSTGISGMKLHVSCDLHSWTAKIKIVVEIVSRLAQPSGRKKQ